MLTHNIKIGMKVELLPWKTLLALFPHPDSKDYLVIPYGDMSGKHIMSINDYIRYSITCYEVLKFDNELDVELYNNYDDKILCMSPYALKQCATKVNISQLYKQ